MSDGGKHKRKRDDGSTAKPKKKVVLAAAPETASVSSVLRAKHCPPVITSNAGIKVSRSARFNSYVPKMDPRAKSKPSDASTQELMLHSTDHQTMDYTAKEEGQRGSRPTVNHYVAVFDPQTGSMEVVQAKKMSMRGTVRAKQISIAEMGDQEVKQSMADRRVDLGQTFGTRKAKKAIESNVLNAISPRKPGDGPTKIDDAARAILASVGQITSTMATREELDAIVAEAKPVPKADLKAEDISDVYDPKAIIGGDILNLVPIREWQEKVKHKEGVQSVSRFVVKRVNGLASNTDDETRLRVLRYMDLLIRFYLNTKPGKQKGTRQIPQREDLREALSPAPEAVIENIRRKFSDAGTLRKFHIDLLMTHCCAFACTVDNFEVDTQDLRDDLRLPQREMNQYFHEIGGRVKQSKVDDRTIFMARLTLPLDFPRQRHIALKR